MKKNQIKKALKQLRLRFEKKDIPAPFKNAIQNTFLRFYLTEEERLVEAVVGETVRKMGITDVDFYRVKNEIHMKITLLRPGIVIGIRGSRIDALVKDIKLRNPGIFERFDFKVDLIQSNLWSSWVGRK